MPSRSRPTPSKGVSGSKRQAAQQVARATQASRNAAPTTKVAAPVQSAGRAQEPKRSATAVVSPVGSDDSNTIRTRRAQREQAQVLAYQQRSTAGRRKKVTLIAAISVVVAVVIGVAIYAIVQNAQPAVPLPEVYQNPSASGQHVPEGSAVHWDYNPPSSGPHYPSPAPWGPYFSGLVPGTWVHNLEHGGVVILYNCPTPCAALQTQLQGVYDQIPIEPQFNEKKIVITPYAGLDHLLRVQAWGWTMPLDSVDTTLIDAFYRVHVDKGPEQIP